MSDKLIKKEFKVEAQKNPSKYYPVKTLQNLGFNRCRCLKCKNFFWSIQPLNICGDSACIGGFTFINDSPTKKRLDYFETWDRFSSIHKKLGYTPIPRYPVVARWRTDTDFVQAGIYVFQPHVVSGVVDPPANPVVEPQFCVRFNDIDNVGITGSHYTGFVMLGEHSFQIPERFNPGQYLSDHLTWLNRGLGLSNDALTIHEDAWAGGGNFGPSMEFFSGGLELSNQVYMMYEKTFSGSKKLDINVLDMGQGMERVPWFTQGSSTSYETTFPVVMRRLHNLSGLKVDDEFMKKFLPYAALLNVDEVENVDKAWKFVASKIQMGVKELRDILLPLSSLYSVAEHSRTLLVALADGALPSNVGGGYNLRVIARRALSFIDRFGWDVSLQELVDWHARYLKPLFPELLDSVPNVQKILDHEISKYKSSKQKTRVIVDRIVSKDVSEDKLLELYDSHGIPPFQIVNQAKRLGKTVKVPDNFFALVSERHRRREPTRVVEEKRDIKGISDTEVLYFGDWSEVHFTAKVVKVVDDLVVLDKTLFYPSSGGQDHDVGFLDKVPIVDVFRQGKVIFHKLGQRVAWEPGVEVQGLVDLAVRRQLTQHHTVAHIVNAAARRILGDHVNQAGARKTLEKGHLDITHYEAISGSERMLIEDEANSIVKQAVKINKYFLSRDEAEKKFTTRIYQGGVAPGKMIRIVDIPGVEVEACGGTHLNNTSEAEHIHIVSVSKIQDGIVRIEFKAGDAAKEEDKAQKREVSFLVDLAKKYFGVSVFLTQDSLRLAAQELSVPVSQLRVTLERFVSEYRGLRNKLGVVEEFRRKSSLESFSEELFSKWKRLVKLKELKEKEVAESVNVEEGVVRRLDVDQKSLILAVRGKKNVLLINSEGNFVFSGSDKKFKELQSLGARGGGKVLKSGVLPKGRIEEVISSFSF